MVHHFGFFNQLNAIDNKSCKYQIRSNRKGKFWGEKTSKKICKYQIGSIVKANFEEKKTSKKILESTKTISKFWGEKISKKNLESTKQYSLKLQ